MPVKLGDIIAQLGDSDTYKLVKGKDVDITDATGVTGSLADDDIVLVDQGALGTQDSTRKSVLSKFWNYISAKLAAVTDVSSYSFVLDETDLASDSSTKIPTQSSVKAYVDNTLVGSGATGPTGPTGPSGLDGVDGVTGPTGPAGPGVTAAGSENQFLQKNSSADYDTKWSEYTLPAALGAEGTVLTADATGSVSFQYPQYIVETVKNVSGGNLSKGTPVHVTGASGNAANVIAADAATNYPAHFILNEDLADEAEGVAIALGFINNVEVDDASVFTPGETVYLGASGGFTTTKPTGANAIQNLGIILKTNTSTTPNKISGIVMGAGRSNDLPNISDGKIWVGNATGVPVETDYKYPVSATGATSGDILVYNASNNALSFKSSFSTFMEAAYQYADDQGYPNLGSLPGDINGDGTVTTADLLLFLSIFGQNIVNGSSGLGVDITGMSSSVNLTNSYPLANYIANGFDPEGVTGTTYLNELNIDSIGVITDYEPIDVVVNTNSNTITIQLSSTQYSGPDPYTSFPSFVLGSQLRVEGLVTLNASSSDYVFAHVFMKLEYYYENTSGTTVLGATSFKHLTPNAIVVSQTEPYPIAFNSDNVVYQNGPLVGAEFLNVDYNGTGAEGYPNKVVITPYFFKIDSQDGGVSTATLNDIKVTLVS